MTGVGDVVWGPQRRLDDGPRPDWNDHYGVGALPPPVVDPEEDTMAETLKYANGRTMNAEPVLTTLANVALQLVDGFPAAVVLEPGDGTRYTLLVVPAWAPGVRGGLGSLGIPVAIAGEYLIVTKLDDTGGPSWFVTAETWSYGVVAVKNEWSRELLAWWLRRLWQQIEHEREHREL